MAKKSALKVDSQPDLQKERSEKLISVRLSGRSRRVHVRMHKGPLLLALALFTVPWALLLFSWIYRSNPNSVSLGAEKNMACGPGPWGQLQREEFIADPPDEFVTPDLFPPVDTMWLFKNMQRNALDALVESTDLKPDEKKLLLAKAESVPSVGWLIKPTDDQVLKLTPLARQRIYQELAKSPENQRQIDPFIFKTGQLDAWLADGNFSPATLANLKKLLYPQDNSMLLADVSLLLKLVPALEERDKLLDVLLRRESCLLKLRVDNKDNYNTLIDYWGRGGRRKEIKPLLDSVRISPESTALDVVFLLPPFAKNRLYTFPLPSTDPVSRHRDCHWSAFNFFNTVPDDRFTDPVFVKSTMDSDYYELQTAPQFGDLAVLQTQDNRIVHSCIHIADGYYFTKNGPSHISPWILMKIEDVKATFPAYENLTVHHFRLKKN